MSSPVQSLGYRDRREAGRVLAGAIRPSDVLPGTLVLGLPRGGVPVAFEVAVGLGLPLDVLTVRKLGVPGHPELAMGAIASGEVRVINHLVVEELGLDPEMIERVAELEARELSRRERAYRPDGGPMAVEGRPVILVDDGVATGATMLAAIRACRELEAERVTVAVPVASPEAVRGLEAVADRVICPLQPEDLFAVGLAYGDFEQVADDEVRALLAAAGAPEVV